MADLENIRMAQVRRGRLSPPKISSVRDRQTDERILLEIQGNTFSTADLTGQFVYGVTAMDSSVQVGYLDTDAPQILSMTPENGEVDIALRPEIEIEFNERMDPSTFDPSSFFMEDLSASVIPTFIFYKQQEKKAFIVPIEPLVSATFYSVTLTSDVKDAHGNNLESGVEIGFTTL